MTDYKYENGISRALNFSHIYRHVLRKQMYFGTSVPVFYQKWGTVTDMFSKKYTRLVFYTIITNKYYTGFVKKNRNAT